VPQWLLVLPIVLCCHCYRFCDRRCADAAVTAFFLSILLLLLTF
jgi:hypothetical protein